MNETRINSETGRANASMTELHDYKPQGTRCFSRPLSYIIVLKTILSTSPPTFQSDSTVESRRNEL